MGFNDQKDMPKCGVQTPKASAKDTGFNPGHEAMGNSLGKSEVSHSGDVETRLLNDEGGNPSVRGSK